MKRNRQACKCRKERESTSILCVRVYVCMSRKEIDVCKILFTNNWALATKARSEKKKRTIDSVAEKRCKECIGTVLMERGRRVEWKSTREKWWPRNQMKSIDGWRIDEPKWERRKPEGGTMCKKELIIMKWIKIIHLKSSKKNKNQFMTKEN